MKKKILHRQLGPLSTVLHPSLVAS